MLKVTIGRLTSKGQSGRSGTTATGTAAERGEFVPVVDIVSMYRAMVPSIAVGAAVGAMMVEDGQTAANWTTVLRVPKVLTLIRLRLVSDMARRVRRRMLPQRRQTLRLKQRLRQMRLRLHCEENRKHRHDARGRSNLHQRNYVRGWWHIATVD